MPPRLPSLLERPIGFVNRSSVGSYGEILAAASLPATGLKSRLFVGEGGVAMLGSPRPRLRRAGMRPGTLPLSLLLAECGAGFHLLLEPEGRSPEPAVEDVQAAGGAEGLERLWLAHSDLQMLLAWKRRWPKVRLVLSAARKRIPGGMERLADQLSSAGVDAVGMPGEDWTGGTSVLFHRFKVMTFGWDAHYERSILNLLDAGLDAVSSDNPERLFTCIQRLYP